MGEKNYFTVMIAGIVKAGMEAYIKDYLTGFMQHSRKHDGCINYNIHQSLDNPSEFMMYSTWKNRESFEHHNQKPEVQEFKRKLSSEMFEDTSPKTYWTMLE